MTERQLLPLDAERLAAELDELQRRLDAGEETTTAAAVRDMLERLRAGIEQLRVAGEQLVDQSDALAEAHLAIEAKRVHYEELFRLAPEAYLVTDEHGTVTEANQSAADLFGVPRRFLAGKPLSTFLAPEARSGFRSRLAELVAQEAPVQFELRFHRRDGVAFDGSITASVVPRRHSTDAIGLRWLIRDVSEQKQTETRLWELNTALEQRVAERTAALEEESTLLEAVLDQLPVGVVIARAPTGRITRSNRRAHELVGGPIQAAGISEYAGAMRTAADRALEAHELPLARAIRYGELVRDERSELARPGGDRTMISSSAAPVRNADGQIVAAVVVLEDVTERERRDRAEREFVVNAAHELRTPLAAIASAVEVLQAGAKDSPEERDLFLGHVARESARLARLGRALLLLARIQSRSERPRLEVVALRPLLCDVAESIRPGQNVRTRVRCRKTLAALANRDLVEQAVLNVAGNAARYTAEGSVALTARADGKWATIEVADTGPGIEPDEAARLFERFYRGGGRDAEGFGLGLAIAKQAIEALGGTLDVDSEVGRGTTARIRLPLARLVDA